VRARTLEGLWAAGLGLALLVLIRAVTTVVRAVTHPVAGDAAVVPTLKLGGCAKLVTVCFVGTVLAIVLLIARPAHRDAASAGAGKEVDRTL
jgi:hypothetical protein